MKVENGKIVEATEDELWNYWYTRGWWRHYSFPDYMMRCMAAGTTIIQDRPSEEEES